jgi:plastocyanin
MGRGPLAILLTIAGIVVGLGALLALRTGARAEADPRAAVVTMGDASFQPATVTVKAGQSVTWKNGSKLTHTATGSGFDSGNIGPGQSWTHTFSKAGTYPYVCVPHQAAGMKGTVVVTE